MRIVHKAALQEIASAKNTLLYLYTIAIIIGWCKLNITTFLLCYTILDELWSNINMFIFVTTLVSVLM